MRSQENPGSKRNRVRWACLALFGALALSVVPVSLFIAHSSPESDEEVSVPSRVAREYAQADSSPIPFAALKLRSVASLDSTERATYRWLGPFGIEVGTLTTTADSDVLMMRSERNWNGTLVSLLLLLLPMTAILAIGTLITPVLSASRTPVAPPRSNQYL